MSANSGWHVQWSEGHSVHPVTVFLQLVGLFAFNLTRERQMQTVQPLALIANSWIKAHLLHILGQIPATT